ncbi:MAG: DUF2291 domain-containing protein [Chitinophagaceae bacterium]
MTGKIVKYTLLLVVLGLVAYKSVYIKKLSEVRSNTPEDFNPVSFSKKLWDEKLPARLDSAVNLQTLLQALKTNPSTALDQYSNALGIGNIRYCLTKAGGRVEAVNPDDVTVLVNHNGSPVSITLATEYVYGNAIRDASGLVDVKDFVNTMDLNNISEELNKQVRSNVLPTFKSSVQKADSISFTGVIELNKEHLKLDELTVIPVRLAIVKP